MATMLQEVRRSIWLGWLFDNPLLVREIRRRMRGRLFSWSLIGYVAALGGVSTLLMFLSYPWTWRQMTSREMIQQIGLIGPAIFKGMLVVEGLIALFIAPMLTAGLASAEKEKDTFDFLRVTTLHASTFVLGCLLTTACFLLLVFACTLPVLALTFIFGGISMQQILSWNFALFLAAMAISAGGVFISTGFRRSRSVHGAILVVCFIVAFFSFRSVTSLSLGGIYWAPGWLANPIVAMLVMMVLATVAFSIAGARRLYEPNNRLFSYRQYTAFTIAALALIGGSLGWEVGRRGVAAFNQVDLLKYISLYYFVGWGLAAMGVYLFSSGQIERGDEVWRLRLRVALFQKFDERWGLYALFLALWLIPAWRFGVMWDRSGEFQQRLAMTAPTLAAAIAMVWSASRLASAMSPNRGRVMMGVAVAVFVVWGILPAIGQILIAAAGGGGTLGELVGVVLVDCSPVTMVYRAWEDPTLYGGAYDLPFIIQAGLTAAAMAPLVVSRRLRRNLDVSYRWFGISHGVPAPQPRPSESTAG